MTTLSAVVLARDEEQMIGGCLARLSFADDIVVVLDDRSSDATASLAATAGARVMPFHFETFAGAKQFGLDTANGDWAFIVDADERVSAALASEVMEVVRGDGPGDARRVPIRNWFFGQAMRHGAWTDERPVRLVRRSAARLSGDIHESVDPVGLAIHDLVHPLEHLSHRSIHHNLAKTASWLDLSAEAIHSQTVRPVTAWRLWAVVGREIAWRFVRRQGWRDGTVGTIEGLYQAFSQFAVMVRLWEMQQVPSLDERYEALEAQL